MIHNDAPYAQDAAQPNTSPLECLAEYTLLPNMRIGAFLHYRETGQRAYAMLDGRCCCHHGEVAGTIRSWLWSEKNDARSGVRWSTCDCKNSSGLTRRVNPSRLPPKPKSYFDLLQASSAAQLKVKTDASVEALATPLHSKSGPIFLANDGRFYCSHGHAFNLKEMPTARKEVASTSTGAPIKKRRTIRRRLHTKACDCLLVLPNRITFPEVPLITPAGPRRGGGVI